MAGAFDSTAFDAGGFYVGGSLPPRRLPFAALALTCTIAAARPRSPRFRIRFRRFKR